MTVLVYRDGVMCSDSQISANGTRLGSMKKVYRNKNWVLGVAGSCSGMQEIVDWFHNGMPVDSPRIAESCAAILVDPSGKVFHVEESLVPYEVDSEFHVQGIGYEIALGALAMGASAEDATKVAIKFHSGCGGKIQKEVLKLTKGK